nr:putative fidgetin-like protein 2 [Vulpes vulpes]
MHWTPEHAQPLSQWPEQHLDVSSTTPSPAHKLELPAAGRQRCHYAWAHDDISALTASNLLKRYAEKYSGVLDAPYERPALGGYGDAAFLNGAKGDPEAWDGVLVVGTTARPAALDEATRRRFALRFYVALPDAAARGQILQRALAQQGCALSERELAALAQGTQGFSGAELAQLCRQAAAGAGLPGLQRPLAYKDLEAALAKVGPRASPKDLDSYVEWDKMYGSGH